MKLSLWNHETNSKTKCVGNKKIFILTWINNGILLQPILYLNIYYFFWSDGEAVLLQSSVSHDHSKILKSEIILKSRFEYCLRNISNYSQCWKQYFVEIMIHFSGFFDNFKRKAFIWNYLFCNNVFTVTFVGP